MVKNPLNDIQDFHQSIWLDYLQRKMILSGELEKLISDDGVRGITSNPAIFNKAIAGSDDYSDDIRSLALQGLSNKQIYRSLTVRDVRMAADLFRPLYDRSEGWHGFVSLEVDPHLAHDAEGTMTEARALFEAVDRPNIFIKVPATLEGLQCIEQLTREGLNINVTLLFSLERYRDVAEAFIKGLEARVEAGLPLPGLASVASFFLSRIDVMVDPILKKKMSEGGRDAETARSIYGEVAIASARRAYRIYKEVFEGQRFQSLAAQGAKPQRLLWASTSTKEPDFSDIKYVEALIGPNTVNTLPLKTINAYRDHGNPAARLEKDPDTSPDVLNALEKVGIDIDEVTRTLEDQGIEKFNQPYDQLLETLEKAREAALREPLDHQTVEADAHESAIQVRISALAKNAFAERLWRKDPTLWPHEPGTEEKTMPGMGWLDVCGTMQARVEELIDFRREVSGDGFRYLLHMGMGGSSLAPLVFQHLFAPATDGLRLSVLDTTDPATLMDLETRLPLAETLFIVASKSGTTTEPLAFGDYFYQRMKEIKGDAAGAHFVAVTDPESPLVDIGRKLNYRRIFLNFPDIGGRYSALSYFGMLPAALMGVDVSELLIRAQRMAYACGPDKAPHLSPGIVLGAALGELANRGRDKITFLVPEALKSLGMWLEQLLAESTGKNGTGLLPVSGEVPGPSDLYGGDRVFI